MLTKEQFNDYYNEQNLSYAEIAKITGINVSKIKRIAKQLGIQSRDRGEAQKVALDNNRAKHPTKGTKRDNATKLKISTTAVETWQNKPNEEKERLRQIHREHFANMSEAEKKEMKDKAHKHLRKTLDVGSKLECFLVKELRARGHLVEQHVEQILNNKKLHLDLLLPRFGLVVEVDGPSHFLPIWGVDSLNTTMLADTMKNGLVIEAGFIILRIQHTKKKLSRKNHYDALNEILRVIENIHVIVKEKQKVICFKMV